MDGFDPRTSFGHDESRCYDATDTRGDEAETVAFLARLAAGRGALESSVGTGRRYGLVYLVHNTIGNVITQDGQVRCFANAVRHLASGGVFVLECRMPSPRRHRPASAQPAPGLPARVRPDGPPGRPAPARPLGRLGRRPLHRRQLA